MGNCECPFRAPAKSDGSYREQWIDDVQEINGDERQDDPLSCCVTSSYGVPSSNTWSPRSDSSNGQRKCNGCASENGYIHGQDVGGDNSSDNETVVAPKQYLRPRRGAVCAERWCRGYFKEPFWNKHADWESLLYEALSACDSFRRFPPNDIKRFVKAMEVHKRLGNEDPPFALQGERADGLFIVLVGSVACYKDGKLISLLQPRAVVDEVAIMWAMPRAYSMAPQGECTVAMLRREDYINLHVRNAVMERDYIYTLLKGTKLLETMPQENISKIVDVMKLRKYPAGKSIIQQGDEGSEFFLMTRGEAVVKIKTGDDEQECGRCVTGDIFGEVALLTNARRAASIEAVSAVEVLVLSRKQFERMLGSMNLMQQQQYESDPRKLISDFYTDGDVRGPLGSLMMRELVPDTVQFCVSNWFAVYRPTSRDAIAKMLSGAAVGKGLNVKGKSSKQGLLSGFVPFVQISDNKHKECIEESPPDARLLVYYKTKASREEARKAFESFMIEGLVSSGGASSSGNGTTPEHGNANAKNGITPQKERPPVYKVASPRAALAIQKAAAHSEPAASVIVIKDEYAAEVNGVFGLEVPEFALREIYIMKPDLSPVLGWETGRRSEPAYMDMNLRSARGNSEPKVVLYQNDESDPMNPRGLLVAYAEKLVKPVVSDFDTFLVGSRGITYDPLPKAETDLVLWSLEKTQEILESLDGNPWMSRWLSIIKRENFHPVLPKYGYGDPTSLGFIRDVITTTISSGAVRHGAECCNFAFPQELDDEYLVIWHGFPVKPWAYLRENRLREFLMERVTEDFCFPLNPVWPVRDPGWYQVFDALRNSKANQTSFASWFPNGILEKIETIYAAHPEGFKILQDAAPMEEKLS